MVGLAVKTLPEPVTVTAVIPFTVAANADAAGNRVIIIIAEPSAKGTAFLIVCFCIDLQKPPHDT